MRFDRLSSFPLNQMSIIDKYKHMGTGVMGKIEAGTIWEGDGLLVMPNKLHVKVLSMNSDETRVRMVGPGENACVKLSGIEEEDILSDLFFQVPANPIGVVFDFNAQLQILKLIDDTILTAGYKTVLHIHAIVEECKIFDLSEEIDLKKKKDVDPKKKKQQQQKPLFVKSGAAVVCRIQVINLICIERFSEYTTLGTFTLWSEGITIAIRKVMGLTLA